MKNSKWIVNSRKWMAGWIMINICWWVISIVLDNKKSIDVNPYLGNLGEILLNIWILVFGFVVLFYYDYYIENKGK